MALLQKRPVIFIAPTSRSHPIQHLSISTLPTTLSLVICHANTQTYVHTSPGFIQPIPGILHLCLEITSSRLLEIIGFFCKRALSKRLYTAKETYNLKEPINRSHLIRTPRKHVCLKKELKSVGFLSN